MKTILVIEDDALVRKGLVQALRRNGYEVQEAESGTEGLKLAAARQPDLVLSDINLPGMTGLEVLQELRARTETEGVPVILMTGEPHKTDARSSMNLGADDYLQKPFSMEQMLATVSARLTRREGITRALDAQNRVERISTAQKIRLQTTALEAAANGIVITDCSGRMVWTNPAFTRLTGYPAEEAMGKNLRILNSGRQTRQFFSEMWAAIRAGNVWQGELVNKRKDGVCYTEEMTITPVRSANGEIQNFIAIKQDVTARKKIEGALAQERDLLQALMDNLPDHIYFKDTNSRFTRINNSLARHLGLQNPEEAMGRSDADYFPLRQARQKLVDERRMLATGEPILGLVEKSDAAASQTWVSSTKVPTYGPDGQIAGMVGISRDITASKQAEDELQRKSAFLEAQINSSIDGILVVDEQGKKILQNRRLTELFSVPESMVEDADDTKLLQWVTETTLNPEQFLEKVRHLYAHPDQISRDEIRLKDGKILDRYSAPMLGKNGAYYGRMWTFRDMTERKAMEESLRHSEEKFRGLVENFRDAIVTLNPETGKFTSANPAALALFGAKNEEEFTALTPASLSPEYQADGSLSREKVRQTIAALHKGPQRFEWIHRRIAGGEFFAEVSLTWMEQGGRPVILSTIRDITQRKQAEEKLRESEEKFRQLAANVTDTFWITSPDLSQIHYVSPAYETIWGRSMESLYTNPHQWIEAIVPEDRERVTTIFGPLMTNTPEVSTEYRVTRPDGTIRWVHDRGFQVRDTASWSAWRVSPRTSPGANNLRRNCSRRASSNPSGTFRRASPTKLTRPHNMLATTPAFAATRSRPWPRCWIRTRPCWRRPRPAPSHRNS